MLKQTCQYRIQLRMLIRNDKGFSLIEIAIVMVIMGILMGSGISLMRNLTERKFRNETADYLKEAREALVTYAVINGTLPYADTDGDGIQNTGSTSGGLPYASLGIKPTDPYKRVLHYELNTNLKTDRATSCETLRAGISGRPTVVDSDGMTSAFPIAAIIVSAGPQDADSDGNMFDEVTSGTHQGDNTDGTPNYIRYPPVSGFDDFVTYLGSNELFCEICEFLNLAVNNNSGAIIYVFDSNRGTDLTGGSIPNGGAKSFDIISGTRIEIHNTASGGGSLLTSIPPNPIILSGNGRTIDVN